MANTASLPNSDRATDELVDQVRRARSWAWRTFDRRIPGTARDLAWALIGLTRDYDPATYAPWLDTDALKPERLRLALDLAVAIAELIRRADKLQPQLIIGEETKDV